MSAANTSEIDRLHHLSTTCTLVGHISQLVHTLQRERGASSIFLGSRGHRFATHYSSRVSDSLKAAADLHHELEYWLSDLERLSEWGHFRDPRLLRQLADALETLEALDGLRANVETQAVTADDAMHLYNSTIRTLLSVVFEVADSACDPDITRILVSLFHFIQGKELAGQERACGALGFTLGYFDDAHRTTLATLIETQSRCFATFNEFADETLQTKWSEIQAHPGTTTLEHLRRLALETAHLPDNGVDAGEQWYALATQRIDALKNLEDALVATLEKSCGDGLEKVRSATANRPATVKPDEPFLSREDGAPIDSTIATHFNRSLIELIQTQNGQLQQLSDELADTRKALRQRKLIDRAKGLLMTHHGLDEQSAYRLLRTTAMDQSRPLAAVAQSIIDADE
nr:nitrate regulatory protein [Larsenimonas suaedae]